MLHFYNYYSMHALSDNFARTAAHDFVHLYSIDSVFFNLAKKSLRIPISGGYGFLMMLNSWVEELWNKKGQKTDNSLLFLSSSRIFQSANPNFGQPNPLLILNIHIREATFYFLKYRKCNSLINKKVGGFGTPCFLKSKIN